MKILLASQSYEGRSEAVSGQRLVNLYAEPNPEGSKYPFSIYSTPGLVEWADLGTTKAVQGMQVMGDNLYALSGNSVFKINDAASETNIGSIAGAEERVDLANDGTRMTAINSAGAGFTITSGGVAAISDPDFPQASSVTFLDGYTIVSKANSGQFNIGGLYDSTLWDALDFATAEESPDNLRRVTAFNSSLWGFGEKSLEVFYNSGNADFPFEQIPGSSNTKRGLAAKYAVAQDDNSLFFLGDDKIFYRIDGYRPVRISTFAVETAIEKYGIIDDAFAFVYTQGGHKFLVFSFPTANASWTYDIATSLWHERTSRIGMSTGMWRANCHADFAGKQLIGDSSNGKIYALDLDAYTEDGNVIHRISQGSVQWKDGQRIIYDRVRLDVDAGAGLITGQGSNPQVVMRYSDNGGKTWSNERWSSIGQIGEFKNQALWRRNGQARERIFSFEYSEPTKFSITGAYADGRIGKA